MSYGTLYTELSEIFQEPYATTLPPLFDGTNDAATVNNACPATLEELMQPELIDAILGDPEHPFIVAAQDNDVYQWIPEVPVEMYYCTQDEQVFYQNALTADTWMTENGSTMHTSTNLGAYDHGQCAGLAIFGGTLWIQDQVEECATNVNELDAADFRMFPNPASDIVTCQGWMSTTSWTIRSLTGTIAKKGVGERLDVGGLPSGIWLVVADGFQPQTLSVAR